MKLDSRYGDYFPEYGNYFGRPLRLNKSMYGMTHYGKLIPDELTNWMIDEWGFKQFKFKMFVYCKYSPESSKLVVLSYVDECVYWYKSYEIRKWSVDTLGNILLLNSLGYEHWFMSIRISQLKDHYISVYQYIFTTSVVAKYLDTATIKSNQSFIMLPYLMIWY